MKVKSTKEENSIIRLEVFLPWADVSDDYDNVIKEISKNIKEPGFRAGKTPADIIQKKYKNEIESEFIDLMLQKLYHEIIKEAKIDPVDSGKLINVNFQKNEDLSFSIEVQIEPEFKLYNYKKKNLEVLKYIIEVEKDDIDRAINGIREQYAEVKDSDKGAVEGDYIEADIQELDESLAPIIGKRMEKRLVKLGEGEFGKQGLEQLKGAVAGDERVVKIHQEHGDHSHNFTFRFTVLNVQKHILPELNDEFAKKVNKSFENIKDLEENVKKNIQSRYDAESRNLVNNSLADELVRVTDLEVPVTMIESYLDGLISRSKEGSNGEIDEAYIRENYKANAIWNMKWLMIRKSIFKKENFIVEESEIDDWFERTAEVMAVDKTAVLSMKKDEDQREKMRQDIIESKVMEVIRSNSNYNEKEINVVDFNALLNNDHHHH
ncbi:MAG: trigger factor [Candidatus Marinimicrobia bacterium]|nr:trigger factor [Candidatus Neomarinimicrobiota bacterium]